MKNVLPAIFIIAFLHTGCVQKSGPTEKKNPIEEKENAENVIRYAKNLRIYDYGSIVKIEISNHVNDSILFRSEIHYGNKGGNKNAIIAPVKNMAALSATQIGMLIKLNALKSLSAVIDKKYLSDTKILHLINHHKLHTFSMETNPSVEEIIASKSKIVLYDSYGNGFTGEDQLKAFGITCIPIADWQEQDPLGKAEWILLYGYLTGNKTKAIELFKAVEEKYLQLKEIAQQQQIHPTVLSGNLISDSWFAPAKGSYNATLFSDAGANYVYANEESDKPSVEKSIESILSENQKTEFWFNPGFSSKSAIARHAKKVTFLPAFRKGQIYCYSHNMNHFWEKSAIEPHHVLEDYIRILHPQALPKGSLHFYKKVK